jgi:hypothetical protein
MARSFPDASVFRATREPRKDFSKHRFDPIQRHLSIEAWSEGALVENTVNGQRGGILDTAGQVPLACNGYNQVGTSLDDYPARNGSSGGNRDVHAVFFRKPQKVLYAAFAAAFTILHPVGDLHQAVFILQAVRHQEQDGAWGTSIAALGQNKLVVYGHERMLDLFAAKARQPAETDQYGQQQLDGNTAELPRKRNITAQGENGGQEPEASEQHGANQGGKDCHYQWKVDGNPAKTVKGHYVEKDQNGGGDDPEKRNKRYYDPLFGTGGRLAEEREGFFWGRFCWVFHVSHSRNEPLGIGLPQVNSHARMRRRPSS